MSTVLVDLGGTRLKCAPREDPSALRAVAHGGDWLPALRDAVRGADEVALCVPGIVAGGRVLSLPDKLAGLEGADLPALLGVRVPVLVNDAIAYGLGEAADLPGRTVVMTLGTGVGVAVVEDGVPLGRGPLGGGLLGGRLPLGDGTVESHCRAAALQGADARSRLARGVGALAVAHAPDRVVVGGGAARAELVDGLEPVGLYPGQQVEVRLARLGDAAALHGLRALLDAQVPA